MKFLLMMSHADGDLITVHTDSEESAIAWKKQLDREGAKWFMYKEGFVQWHNMEKG
jgi:alkyl hydroperoxide reductase subunit AhpC